MIPCGQNSTIHERYMRHGVKLLMNKNCMCYHFVVINIDDALEGLTQALGNFPIHRTYFYGSLDREGS